MDETASVTGQGTVGAQERATCTRRVVLVLVLVFPLALLAVLAVLPFFVEASIVRIDLVKTTASAGDSETEPLRETGSILAPGEAVSLAIEIRDPHHVYVFAVDSDGREHTLFPDPRLETRNPIPAGASVVPGPSSTPDATAGRAWPWETDAGSVLFFVYACREPVEEAEALARRLPAPSADSPASAAAMTDDERTRRAFKTIQAHLILHKKLNRRGGVTAVRYVVGCAETGNESGSGTGDGKR